MKFRSILSFFNKTTAIPENTKDSELRSFFTKSLINNDFHNLEHMLEADYQINEEQFILLQKKLEDIAGYFHPRNFYKPGLRLANQVKPNFLHKHVLKTIPFGTFELNEHIEENINNLQIHVESKHIRYFQLISKYNLLDDFILEHIQSKSGIGQFFNVISGTNYYQLNQFQTGSIEKYNEQLNANYLRTQQEPSKISIENYIKRNTKKAILDELSHSLSKHILNTNELQSSLQSTQKYSLVELKERKTVMRNLLKEQFPINDLKKMSFVSFITPTLYTNNSASTSQDENEQAIGQHTNGTTLSLKENISLNHHFKFTYLDGPTRFTHVRLIFSHLNSLSQNIFKRISIDLQSGENEIILNNMLDNKNIYSYCSLTNNINNFSKFSVPYNLQTGEQIIKAISYVKKRKPHILISDNILNSVESQVQLANSLILKFYLHNTQISDRDELDKHLLILKNQKNIQKTIEENIQESLLPENAKTILLETIKTRNSIIENYVLSHEEEWLLNSVPKKVQQVINFTELVSNPEDIIEHSQSIYEEVFKIEYSLVKKKRDSVNEQLLALEELQNSKKKMMG